MSVLLQACILAVLVYVAIELERLNGTLTAIAQTLQLSLQSARVTPPSPTIEHQDPPANSWRLSGSPGDDS
jgi:hypothetical protein